MKTFEYLEFNDDSFVFDSKLYTKEEALEIVKEAGVFEDYTVDDVKESYCAYRFSPSICQPEWGTNGAYFLVEDNARGSFKVWVIK